MAQNINVRKFAGTAASAAVINSIIFLIAKSADATMVINQGGSKKISLGMVIGVTFFALVIASFFAALIGMKSQGFVSRAPLIGLVFSFISTAVPFSASDDLKTSLGLATMHVVAGLFWYVGTKRSIR